MVAHINFELFLAADFVTDWDATIGYHGMNITMEFAPPPFKGVNVFKETFLQASNDKQIQIIQVPKVKNSNFLEDIP